MSVCEGLTRSIRHRRNRKTQTNNFGSEAMSCTRIRYALLNIALLTEGGSVV